MQSPIPTEPELPYGIFSVDYKRPGDGNHGMVALFGTGAQPSGGYPAG